VSLNAPPARPSPAIRLLLADVDGTLVTPDKALTEAAIAAVGELHEAGILFALTSGRPPRGMSMLIEPLDVRTPIAAFNGGLLVDRDMTVIEQRTIPPELVAPTIELLRSHGLDVWLYQGADWFVQDLQGPHVDREAATVQFAPTLRATTRVSWRGSPRSSAWATTTTRSHAPRPPPRSASATTSALRAPSLTTSM
jgi:hydroxymethylpyrimidine pyrophosphatase-like HAD family hydrolase